MVSEASRMFSAISFGVFCRAAPSTRLIIRSMKVSPGFVVILMTMRSESTFVPPVTADAVAAGLADDRGRLAGDRRLVDGGDALDDVTVAGDDVAGLADDQVADAQFGAGHLLLRAVPSSAPGDGVGLGLAQGVGLRLAAALGHRLRQVGEDRRSATARRLIAQPNQSPGSLKAKHRGQHRADQHHEHHGRLDHHPRVELAAARPAAT